MMVQAFIVNADGTVVQRFRSASPDGVVKVLLEPGQQVLIYDGPDDIDGVEAVLTRGQWKFRAATVDPGARLETRKALARQRINVIRDALQEGTAHTPEGDVDIDAKSMAKIGTLVRSALAARIERQTFSVAFTLADNSDTQLDAARMLAVDKAINDVVVARHEFAKVLKRRVEAATTLAQLEAVDVETGWP